MFTAIEAVKTYSDRMGGWLAVLFIENVPGITHRRQIPGRPKVCLCAGVLMAQDALVPLTVVP